jgi:hypothetical protein
VHKESLTSVENALPNRSNLDVEIFGMEGIPEDVLHAHNQRVIGQLQRAESERRAATGNPPPGAGSGTKKPKFESPLEMKKRLAEHKARLAEQNAGGSSGGATPNEFSQRPQSPGLRHSPGPYVSLSSLSRAQTNCVRDHRLIQRQHSLLADHLVKPFPRIPNHTAHLQIRSLNSSLLR